MAVAASVALFAGVLVVVLSQPSNAAVTVPFNIRITISGPAPADAGGEGKAWNAKAWNAKVRNAKVR